MKSFEKVVDGDAAGKNGTSSVDIFLTSMVGGNVILEAAQNIIKELDPWLDTNRNQLPEEERRRHEKMLALYIKLAEKMQAEKTEHPNKPGMQDELLDEIGKLGALPPAVQEKVAGAIENPLADSPNATSGATSSSPAAKKNAARVPDMAVFQEFMNQILGDVNMAEEEKRVLEQLQSTNIEDLMADVGKQLGIELATDLQNRRVQNGEGWATAQRKTSGQGNREPKLTPAVPFLPKELQDYRKMLEEGFVPAGPNAAGSEECKTQ
jgi:hypothetical protein